MPEAWVELRALNDRLERELAAAVAREAKLREALGRAAYIAEHLFGMIDRETWRATGGDDSQGHYEGDYRAEQTREEIRQWAALASPDASRECPRCHGEGVVTFNKSRDPQRAEDGVCDVCHGTGDAPAEPATEETRITYGGQFVQPVETFGVSPTHGEATITASFVSGGTCECGHRLSAHDVGGNCLAVLCCCPEYRAASSVSAEAGQVPADTIEKAESLLRRRRLPHFSYAPTSSSCCRNCNQRAKDEAMCSREGCGAPFNEWRERPCSDPELDEVLAALAAVRTPEEKTT